MKLTIYHTTSSIFLKSIKENGLTGIDIRRKIPQLCEAMSEMIEVLDHNYADCGTDWGEKICFRQNSQRMADINYQNRSAMDYEYGSLYVTPSITKTCVYYTYEFGSELLSYFSRLYRCLFQKHGDSSRQEFDTKYPDLVRILAIKNKRNFVLMAVVDTADLLTDTGKELQEDEIDFIKFFQNKKADIQRSYRLTKTLMPDEISIMSLEGNNLEFVKKLSEYEIPNDWEQLYI